MTSKLALSFFVAMKNNNDATAAPPQRKKARTQKWRCDVCKMRTFLDIKECEAHEAICEAVAAAPPETKGTANAGAVEPPTLPPVASDKPPPPPAKREQAEWLSARKASTERQRTTRNKNADEVVDVKKAGKKKRASSVHPFFQGDKTAAAPQTATSKKKPQKKAPSSKECTDLSMETNNTAKASQDEAVKVGAPRRKTKTDENSLNAFFQGANAEEIKAMQAAQKVAEFQAKRRRRQELERERRQKRQKQQQATSSDIAAPETTHSNKPKAEQQQTKQL